MYEILGLPMGDISYEEYVPTKEELHLLKTRDPMVYYTYWELFCHYHIYTHMSDTRNVKQKKWLQYLLPNFSNNRPNFTYLPPVSEKEVERKIANFGTNAYVAESDENVFKAGTSFETFHYQTLQLLSDPAFLAGYLILWLKKCVIPSHDTIPIRVIYPAVLLAFGQQLSLLPAMVCSIQSGLRKLVDKFCNVRKEQNNKVELITKTPNSRIELPYTYLMTWLVLHCPTLMSPADSQVDLSASKVQHYERSQWKGGYMAAIRKTFCYHANFELFKCFPYFPNVGYGEEFADVAGVDKFTALSPGCFWWLINICPGQLVLRLGSHCYKWNLLEGPDE